MLLLELIYHEYLVTCYVQCLRDLSLMNAMKNEVLEIQEHNKLVKDGI